MRSLKELYGMLYEHIKDLTYIIGLCHEILCAYISGGMSALEYDMLRNHFKAQRFLHSEFQTKERNWDPTVTSNYWWTCDEDDNPVNRIAFIKKLMETAE